MYRVGFILLAIACFGISGCIDETSEYSLNSDGSGKVVYEVTINSSEVSDQLKESIEKEIRESFGGNGELKTSSEVGIDSGQRELKETAEEILTKSSGVDVWKDVSYKLTEDKGMYFKGTAYFSDINKLEINNSSFTPKFSKNRAGEIVIELISDDGDCEENGDDNTEVKKLSKAELDKRVKEAISEYNESRIMMQGFLSSLKGEVVLHLPGEIKEISNFEKLDDRSVRMVFEGARILEIMDEIMADDEVLRKQIREGKDPTDYSSDDFEMNEKLFGQKGPIQVVLKADAKHDFDYDSEVKVAKQNYKKMMSELGLEAAIVERDVEVLVPKVRNVGVAENYGEEKLRLSMSVKLPEKAISVMGGKIEKAIAGTGKNVLGDKSWDKKEELYKISEKIVRTTNITQSTVVGTNGWYSTVVAAAVFLF